MAYFSKDSLLPAHVQHLLIIICNVIIHHDNDLFIWNSISVYDLVRMAHVCLEVSRFSLLALMETLMDL